MKVGRSRGMVEVAEKWWWLSGDGRGSDSDNSLFFPAITTICYKYEQRLQFAIHVSTIYVNIFLRNSLFQIVGSQAAKEIIKQLIIAAAGSLGR